MSDEDELRGHEFRGGKSARGPRPSARSEDEKNPPRAAQEEPGLPAASAPGERSAHASSKAAGAAAREAARCKRGRWSNAERARVRQLYGLRDEVLIAQALKRPVASVLRVARDLFGAPIKTGPWTEGETAQLKRYLGASSPEVIARILGRSAAEVRARIEALGQVRNTERWSRAETAELKRIYGSRPDEALALIFGRCPDEIRRVAGECGLSKGKAFVRKLSGKNATRMPRWQPAELELFKSSYTTRSNLELARRLGRSVKSISSKASQLHLKKSRERLREMGRLNVSSRYR
jgi:hypothetical protein